MQPTLYLSICVHVYEYSPILLKIEHTDIWITIDDFIYTDQYVLRLKNKVCMNNIQAPY